MNKKILNRISAWVGWCPMHGATPSRENSGPETPWGDGLSPVRRRTRFFAYLTWIVVALSFLAAYLTLPTLPDIIPVHWNLYGDPDGFSGKILGAFGIPVISMLTAIFLTIISGFESKGQSLEKNRDMYQIMIFSTVCFLFALEILVLLESSGISVPLAVALPMLMGVLFIVIGCLMPHIERNTIMGIRFPWTMRDDEIWRKTHERGGAVFVAGGLVIVFGSLPAGKLAFVLMLVVLAVVTVYITVYSYRLAKKESENP